MYFSHINYSEDPIKYVWFDKIFSKYFKIFSKIMVNIKKIF